MDQAAQSSQTEIVLRSLQLKKEQIEAFFNQHRLIAGNNLQDNQLSENVNPIANAQLQIDLNHQLNQQLLNHQLSQQLSLQMHPKCLSPEAPIQMSSFFNPTLPPNQLYLKENDALKKRLGSIGQLRDVEQLFGSQFEGNQLASAQLNNATKLVGEPNAQFKFIPPSSLKQLEEDIGRMQAPQPPSPVQTNSAFKPVARRKDSVYSMDCKTADGKLLTYNQQIIDLLKTKTIESMNSKPKDLEPNRRLKSPKKSYNPSRKSPTSQLAKPSVRHNSMDQSSFNTNSSGFPSPNQYSYRNKLNLSNSPPNNSNASLNSSPFNSSSSLNRSHLPLNHSLNYCREDNDDDDNLLPLDMTNKSGKPKNEPDEPSLTLAKKKLSKEADLGQYINKIISENAAIVEQNELRLPLTKRLNSRNSTSNVPSFQLKCRSGQQPRMNRSISVIQPPVQLQRSYNELNQENLDRDLERLASIRQTIMLAERDDRLKMDMLNHESPKLVSALRGQLESNETIKPLVKQPANLVSDALFNNPFYSLYHQSQQRKLSDGNYLQHPKQLEWDTNSMKSYFNSKAPTIKVTPPSFSQGESSDNPDNYSQSSIIKDLLLVSKDATFQQSDKLYLNELKNKPEDLKTGDQEELSCLVYVCTICNIAFRNKETLAAHQTHYCKNNQSNKDLYSEVSRLAGVSKIGSADDLTKIDRSKDALGILKQHLLHPNSSCPLPKKRKISEPCFPSSSLNSHSLFASEAASFKAASTLAELRPSNDQPKDSNAVYFSNFGLEAQGTNVARKISVLHPANKPYFITIKQPVFEHDHLIDLRQVPGQPAQLNNQLFHKSECSLKLLKSDHNNSITKLTDLSQMQQPTSCVAATSISQSPMSRSPRITHSPVQSHKNSTHSSHKFIDQPKDYTLISEYLPHYERKITVKGELKFDILTKTLEKQGEAAEFKQSYEEETCSNVYKINNQVRQISSMPEFIEKNEPSRSDENNSLISKASTSAVIDLTDSLRESEQSAKVENAKTEKSDDKKDGHLDSAVNSDKSKNRCDQSVKNGETTSSGEVACATKRPASLFNCLPKKPSHLTCSTLVSPETPRSEKTFVQSYQNGQLYTYLTKKRSTRVTFCCIYRPQPMFIEQSVEPKLSMYSNWQIFPPYEEILQTHKAPILMKYYDSRQWKHRPNHYTSKFTTKLVLEEGLKEPVDESANATSGLLSSDQLETRDEPEESTDKGDKKEPVDDKRSLTNEYLQQLRQVDDRNGCLMLPTFSWMMQMLKQDRINIKIKLREFKKKFCEESSDMADRLMKRRRKLSRKISDEFSINSLDARQANRKQSSTTSKPKRIYIFEGGFKSNEDYVYIRGKGKGKYVCAECGIRCKKPSMLRKHIRTHTDLRPYSCLHCSFAFKTKGNLTKHMKSKAHHKKCAELGISPVPTSIDTHTQIDSRALAIQEAMERASNQPSYLNDDYDEDMDDMLDDSDDILNLMDDDMDDDQLDLKYGIDEDDDVEEDDDEEEYMLRLNNGIDQHLHIICLRIISSNFSVNKNDPLVGLDTSNNYLGVNIGCLTNFKRLSAFNDIILPNSTTMNRAGNDRLNKFSVIQDAFNSIKNNPNQFSNSLTNSGSASVASKSIDSQSAVKTSSESAISQPAASRLFNQTESASLDVVKVATDSTGLVINKSSDPSINNTLINVLDNNNNLVTLSRARLTADDSMQPNTAIRHKHSLIGGVNSASLASIPEAMEEECRREEELVNCGSKVGTAVEDSSSYLDLDGNFEISQPVDATAGTTFRGVSSEPKRKFSEDEERTEEDCDRRKRQRSRGDDKSAASPGSCSSDKSQNERTASCSLEQKGDKSINNGDVSNDRVDKVDQAVSTNLVTSGLITNMSNMSNSVSGTIAQRRGKSEPDSGESTEGGSRLAECTLKELNERKSEHTSECSATDRAAKSTLTTGRQETATIAKNVIDLNSAASYLSHHKSAATVGGVTTNDEKVSEKASESKDKRKEEPSKPSESQAKRTYSNDSESSSDNECPSSKESSTEKTDPTDSRSAMQLINLSQLSADAIPKLNLDHRGSSRPKSLPPPGLNLGREQGESRSSSANSTKISEIDEHEVAHSLLSLSRSQSTTPNPITLPLKRKISQGFGPVPYHHGNYFYIGDANNQTSPAVSPLTTYSDEEVSRAFKKHNNFQIEKSWPSEEWKLKDEINRKFSEKGTSSSRKLGRSEMGRLSEDLSVSRLNSSTKLSEKLAEIKRTGLEDPLNLKKQLDDNDDIQKLLQKVENKAKSEEEMDQNKLISIYIQNKIDKHERILNDGTLNVNPTPSPFAVNPALNKQPAVDNCRMNICTICNKTFSEESSLMLHQHIHYFERPFRCAICQVSFRSTGHLQKHIRSVSHQNKLNQSTQFGQPSPTNPRPFKCSYCKISFRIFGHLSKHLRSKVHIGKLEGLGKLPPGLYSLMERNRIQLNDLDTTDCETNLQSLCKLAQRLQANGDLPIAPNLSTETYSPTSHSSFVCSSAYCESSNEDSNLSSGKSIDDKQSLGLGYQGLNEGSPKPAGVQFSNDLQKYGKLIPTNQMNQLALSQPIPLHFNTSGALLPIDPKLKPIGLIPSHLIDNFAILSGHYIPQQKFFDQQACKHPHHLYPQALPRNEDDVESLPHGHPLPKANLLKSYSPEINVLEDSNESSRSSARLEIEISDKEAKENTETDKVPNTKVSNSSSPPASSSSPIPSSSSSKARSTSPRDDFASIQLNSNTCSICNQVFKSAKFLQVHLFEKKGISREEHARGDKVEVKVKESDDLDCKICGKKLDDIDQFKSHAQIHSVARPFICEVCDAGFSSKSSLDSHSKTHKS